MRPALVMHATNTPPTCPDVPFQSTQAGPEPGPPDMDAALRHFRNAAAAGNALGQFGLAYAHLEGKGVDKDAERAFKLFSQVCAGLGWWGALCISMVSPGSLVALQPQGPA